MGYPNKADRDHLDSSAALLAEADTLAVMADAREQVGREYFRIAMDLRAASTALARAADKAAAPEILRAPQDKENRPIPIGAEVVGNDGKAWVVDGYVPGKRHCLHVCEVGGKATRELVPSWVVLKSATHA